MVGLKEAVFQSSSPLRHATELHSLLLSRIGNKTIMFMYSDGGPDHRLTYVSVQLSLIALFLNLNLDFLVACRTAPNHSWKNPVERIMSLLNIGLQCVGLMRAQMSVEFESVVNPLRACAARVTVVGSVCLCVCVSVCLLSHISPMERLFVLKTLSRTQRATKVKKFVGFSLKPLRCRDPSLPPLYGHAYSRPFFLRKARMRIIVFTACAFST